MKKPLKIIAIVILTLIVILSFGCNKYRSSPVVGLNTKMKISNFWGNHINKIDFTITLISFIKEYGKTHSKPVTTYKKLVLLKNN